MYFIVLSSTCSTRKDDKKLMEAAVHKKDFQTFAKLTMQDSNQFHAIYLDTHPPITYMNGTSQRIISLITKHNSSQKELIV